MALVLLAGAGYAYYKQQEAQFLIDEDIDLEGKSSIEFMELELKSNILQTTLSTITFFEGDYTQVAPRLQRRVDAIRKTNPWLGGWICRRREDPALRLWYDSTSKVLTPEPFVVFEPGQVPLSSTTPYDQLEGLSLDYNLKVPTTNRIVGKNVPLWKISLIPDAAAPTEKFSLIVSMAHLLGDAHTFYQLYALLGLPEDESEMDDIPEINAERIPEFQAEALARLGEEECRYITKSNPGMWERKSKDPKHEILMFTVREKWIEAQRQLAMPPPTGEADDDATAMAISDPAILICNFFRDITKPTVALVAYSMRNYCSVLGEMDAGNYQNPIPYSEIDYATPQLLQRSKGTGKRCGSDPPSELPSIAGPYTTFSFAVDWTRFLQHPLDLGSAVQQVIHMPLLDTTDLRTVPPRLSGMILFPATPGKLGVVCFLPKKIDSEIMTSGIVDETIAAG